MQIRSLTLIAVISCSFPPPPAIAAQPPAQPSMVLPETLDQGFIIIVEDKARRANEDSPIYFAGSINNWGPGDRDFRMTPQSDGRWRLHIKKPVTGVPAEFKFTRGSWQLEELDDSLNPIPNRTFPKIDTSTLKPGELPILEFTVIKWGDQRPNYVGDGGRDPYKPIKADGNLRRVQFVGGSGGAEGAMREALVLLPPGYDEPANSQRRYPVLYMFDAQNLFAKHSGVASEWRVDETANELAKQGKMEPIIIVGLPHSGQQRIREYLPVAALDSVTPAGEQYITHVINHVKPRVDTLFRTKPDAANTGAGGASLGGAMAIYATTSRPDVFSRALVESLPIRTGKAQAWDSYFEGVKTWPARVFVGMGGMETGADEKNKERNASYVEAIRALDQRMQSAGVGADRRMLVIDPEARHNEEAWAKRLPAALKFLYPPTKD